MVAASPDTNRSLFTQYALDSIAVQAYGAHQAQVRHSIVILTYSRDPVLRDLLSELSAMLAGREDYEIILVDNNADPVDRGSMLGQAYSARWLRMPRNHGVSARNWGMAAARGDYIVVIDDDCFVKTDHFLDAFATLFEDHPDVGAITIKKLIHDTMEMRRDIIPHTRKDVDLSSPFLTFRIVGGCVAFRREVFQSIGGFSAEIFYGIEEIELSYRIIDAGWKILYAPNITAVELEHPAGRRPTKIVATQRLANKYMISFLHMPFPHIVFNYVLFTPYTFLFYRGQVNVPAAIFSFMKWLGRKDRARRRPIQPRTVAYIKACDGSVWR